MKRTVTVCAVASALVFGACGGSPGDYGDDAARSEATVKSKDDEGSVRRDAAFVYEVVASQYAEIKLAELANQRSRNPEIQQLARVLLEDHTASINALKILARSKAITVPVQEASASRRTLERMAEESGEAFDKRWTDEMASLHKDVIGVFEARLDATQDTELKVYIANTLPVLRKHYETLRQRSDQQKQQAVR